MRTFVSPHLDDAVLSCWTSLVASQAQVVTCFTADPPATVPAGDWDRYSNPGLLGRQIMKLRREEDLEALASCRATAIHLDLPDHQYREGQEMTPDTLAEHLSPLLRDATEVWVPAGIGGHLDHVLVQKAVLLVANQSTAIVLYADQPYAGSRSRGWPLWVDRRPRTIALELFRAASRKHSANRRWHDDLAAAGLSTRLLEAHVIKLTKDQVSEKTRAVHTYRTQAKALGYTDVASLMRQNLLSHEVFWKYPVGVSRV